MAAPAAVAPAPREASPPPPAGTPATGICSASGWCWYHPLPQGNRLDTLVGTTSAEVWATGLDTLLRFDGQRWERLGGTPADTWFRQLAPRASGGFWALGQRWHVSGEQGLLYAWDGHQWLDSGLRMEESWTMWVAGDRDIWLVTAEGALSRWDGQTLRKVVSPTRGDTRALSGTGERDVWLAASDGLFHWDGQRWSRARPASKSVLVRGPGDVWSVDDDGVHHLEGTTWRSWPLAPDSARRVYGGDGGVWLVDSNAVFRLVGDAWQRTMANEHRVNTLWVAPDGTAWAMGDRAVLMRWDGAAWTQPPTKPWFNELRAMWGAADDDIWAAGGGGLILHFDGRAWDRVPAPATATIGALWGSGPNDVWGVGEGVFHWDGHAWSHVPVHMWGRLDAVWGTSATDVWAQGDHMVLHFDGCWWSSEFVAQRWFRGRGGAVTARGEVWTPFNRGILRRRAQRWQLDRGPPGVQFTAIHGSESSGLWASGRRDGQPVLLALDPEERWHLVTLPPASKGAERLHVQGSDAIYIVDENGAVHRRDGAVWHDEAQDLSRHGPGALWVSPGGDIWLTTRYGNGGLLGKRARARPDRPAPPSAAPAVRTCGPDPAAVALASAFTTADDANRRGALPMADAAAREVARVWLEAMRDMRSITLARATALPLTIDGFGRCGSPREALDVEGFRDLLDCILGDSLATYVPADERGGWTRRGASGNITGTLKVIRPAGLARPLARHRRTVETLALAGQVLVQARMTDSNGVVNHAVLAVLATPRGPRVTTVLFDTHFDE